MGRLKRNRVCVGLLVVLYVGTWIGGWGSHARQLRDHAEGRYRAAEKLNRELAADPARPAPIDLHEGGPTAEVAWCLPVLPGVLLAYSGYSAGPLFGRGGVKVVLYYGFGSAEVCTLCGWVA
jgi:hypothetical protein